MIKTKIAKILGPSRFILAAGEQQGVQVDSEFIIYELSDPVYDPETKESLGQLELHKGRVKVVHVQDKLSTAVTLMRKRYRPGLNDFYSIAFRLGSISNQGDWVEEREELPIDNSTATVTKIDLTVKVGDLVRSVSD